MKKLIDLNLVIALLETGDDEGCDGLVVVGRNEFMQLRKLVYEKTGQWYGYVSGVDDEDEESQDQDEE